MLYIEIDGKKKLEVVGKRDDYPSDEPVPEPSYRRIFVSFKL
jgi:hypothetical protein